MTVLSSGLFITVRTHWLSSFVLCCSDTVLATQQTAATEQSNYCYMYCSRTSSAIHLASPVINKESGRKLYSSHAWSYERRELSMSKFSLWLTYSTCKNTKRKPQQKKSMCVNYTANQIFITLFSQIRHLNDRPGLKRHFPGSSVMFILLFSLHIHNLMPCKSACPWPSQTSYQTLLNTFSPSGNNQEVLHI